MDKLSEALRHEIQFEYHLRKSKRGPNKVRNYHRAKANEHFNKAHKIWKTFYKNSS